MDVYVVTLISAAGTEYSKEKSGGPANNSCVQWLAQNKNFTCLPQLVMTDGKVNNRAE